MRTCVCVCVCVCVRVCVSQVRCRYLLRVTVTGKGMQPDSKREFNIWVTNFEEANESAAPIKVSWHTHKHTHTHTHTHTTLVCSACEARQGESVSV